MDLTPEELYRALIAQLIETAELRQLKAILAYITAYLA